MGVILGERVARLPRLEVPGQLEDDRALRGGASDVLAAHHPFVRRDRRDRARFDVGCELVPGV